MVLLRRIVLILFVGFVAFPFLPMGLVGFEPVQAFLVSLLRIEPAQPVPTVSVPEARTVARQVLDSVSESDVRHRMA